MIQAPAAKKENIVYKCQSTSGLKLKSKIMIKVLLFLSTTDLVPTTIGSSINLHVTNISFQISVLTFK